MLHCHYLDAASLTSSLCDRLRLGINEHPAIRYVFGMQGVFDVTARVKRQTKTQHYLFRTQRSIYVQNDSDCAHSNDEFGQYAALKSSLLQQLQCPLLPS